MAELNTNTQPRTAGGASEPLGPVRENRIDPPHVMANGRGETLVEADAGDACDREAEVEVASLAIVQQLRLQAQQLSQHLGQQQSDLDRREAELQAREAQLDQQERNNRLWLRDRHEEFSDREAAIAAREQAIDEQTRRVEQAERHLAELRHFGEQELAARREALERREAAMREADEHIRERLLAVETAAAALQDAGDAHEALIVDLEQRQRNFEARRGMTIEMIHRLLAGEAVLPARQKEMARGEAAAYLDAQRRSLELGGPQPDDRPRMRDEFDELGELLIKLQAQGERLREREALLERAEGEVTELRYTLSNERQQFDAERQSDRRRREEQRRRAEADVERRRESLESGSRQLELRRAAVEQLQAELTVAQREALENRLATEELLAELAGAIPPAQLTHQIARLRSRLAEWYRLQQEDLTSERRRLETLAAEIAEQHARLAEQKRELEQWLRARALEAEADAARLAERESQLDCERNLVEKQRFDWEHERQEYQRQIRRLLAESAQ